MERMLERCAGLDVHKKTVTACVRVPGAHGDRTQHVRTFDTTTAALLVLRDWLAAHAITHVAMESTGARESIGGPSTMSSKTRSPVSSPTPRRSPKCPGRKTDVKDGVWIAQLLEPGLMRASFVPPAPIRELRDLTRSRKVLIQERTRPAHRLHKVLEDAGITLISVARRRLGVSGRAMLDALVAGTTDPEVLADLARGRLRKKRPALRQALVGRFRSHHAFLVSQLLAPVDDLDEAIQTSGGHLDEVLVPFTDELARLDTIRGINQRTAEVVIAEIGVDMTVFPTAKHLASWAGLCPGNNQSAGQHRSGKTRPANRWLRAALSEAAWAASTRAAPGAFAARYRRILPHRGHKEAIVAVARAMLVTIYHQLTRQTTSHDPGTDDDDRRHAERLRRRALQTLERQGYRVTLEPAA